MAPRVKTRRYDNSKRLDHARQTKRSIVDAARSLFVDRGYAATSLQAIAKEAGVAVQTVYAAFGSKPEILRAVFAAAIRGSAEDVPVADQPDWVAWQKEEDPARKIALFATANRHVAERTADVVAVVSAAATSGEQVIAEMWEDAERARYSDQRRLASALASAGRLRKGLPAKYAADIIWTLAGPAVFNDLIRRRGWSADAYERWLADQLTSALLGGVRGGAVK